MLKYFLILDILYGVSRYGEDLQMSKACTRCGEVKELSNFYFNTKYNNHQSHCKQCVFEAAKEYRKTDKGRKNGRKIGKILYSSEEGRIKLTARANLRYLIIAIIKLHTGVVYRKHPRKLKGVGLIGCSLQQYKAHIESQFEDWMNWGNYGRNENTWQIDHIIPFDAFKGELKKHLKIICWYKNCKPVRSKNNYEKGSIYTEEGKHNLIKRYRMIIT